MLSLLPSGMSTTTLAPGLRSVCMAFLESLVISVLSFNMTITGPFAVVTVSMLWSTFATVPITWSNPPWAKMGAAAAIRKRPANSETPRRDNLVVVMGWLGYIGTFSF